MNKETQPIDRETLLKEANKIIREHEDTLAGIEATGVTQRNGVLVFTGDYFLDEQGLPQPKAPRCLICSNTWPMCFQKNIIWLINAKREVLASRLSFTSMAFDPAATSVATIDRRSLPRCR